MTTQLPDLLTPEEVSKLLRLSRSTIYAMVTSKRIPHLRVANRIRFSRDELLRYLNDASGASTQGVGQL